MLVATRALWISSGFVDLARLMASMSTVKPVSARAAASEMSRSPGLSCCFLKSSLTCRMSGFLAWRSRAKKECL